MIENGGGKIAWLVLGTVDPHTWVQIPPLTLIMFLDVICMESAVSFTNSRGQKLAGMLHIPESAKNSQKSPAVILCHGFSGDKTGKYRLRVRIARELCKNGFVVLRFDFSGHGDSEGEMDDVSITPELDDLECAINFLKSQPEADIEKIGIVGHSFGGEIVILEAAKNNELKAVVLLAPVVDPKLNKLMDDRFEENLALARKQGYAERVSHKIKKQYYEEMKKFKPLAEAKKISAPLLVLHGTADDKVAIPGSVELVKNVSGPKKLVIIETADHDFVGYDNTMRIIKETAEWFGRWLKQ